MSDQAEQAARSDPGPREGGALYWRPDIVRRALLVGESIRTEVRDCLAVRTSELMRPRQD
jgi:hypothetical protein